MNSPFPEAPVGGPALSLTPLPDTVACRRSGPPRDFNCFCVFCTKAAEASQARPPRAAGRRSH
ncbi:MULTISPECIES: hypothetical protein [unclassified Streptomyces]|uniref:hypothetical protein n=1 Tax=unclassified Streptomyces TaxID=2593676 RepID=UPI0004CA39E0|nr:hypothetical protein [Streptomyces sp. NRRL F-2747]